MTSRAAQDDFSIAAGARFAVTRWLLRGFERAIGQAELEGLYRKWEAQGLPPDTFWDAAIELLQIDLRLHGALPKKSSGKKPKPLVIVANHPFGVLDGILLCGIAQRLRPDFKILINDVLCRIPSVNEHALPISFQETRAARDNNLASRRAARETLQAGGCVVVFPGGGVATAPHIWGGTAEEFPWAPLTANLIRRTHADVLPIWFDGQNSRLFHIVSYISIFLRWVVMFSETHRRIGTRQDVVIGDVLPYRVLAKHLPPQNLMQFLQAHTLALRKKISDST